MGSETSMCVPNLGRTYTITTAKGSHTGALVEVCLWQAEMQAALADIDGVSVDGVDFDAEDIDATVEAVREALVEEPLTSITEAAAAWDACPEQGPKAGAARLSLMRAIDLARSKGATNAECRDALESGLPVDSDVRAVCEHFRVS